eukprot:TRINITY_DN44704_c0_g1_i1.p1 TRINITY_DN44704_c0_g1~~TRINITY_DN44704_c0_g1_i1.p1  ORF type:complete len:433 (-),score=85.27 TRINITY_DN44704_c0_g1_i1:405-1628(-)
MAELEPHILQRYGGEVIVVDSASLARDADLRLRDELGRRESAIVGLDLEWLPDRTTEHNHPVALMQVALSDKVWLFRTCFLAELPPFLASLLHNPLIVKVVTSFEKSDRAKLEDSFGLTFDADLESHGFLDISSLAQELGHRRVGLKKIAVAHGLRIEKRQDISVSDWETVKLSPDQCRYASDDAWFPLLLADRLLKEEVLGAASGLRTRAREALEAEHGRLSAALVEESSAAQDVAAERVSAELQSILEEMGKTLLCRVCSLAHRRLPPGLVEEARVSVNKHFFLERKEVFALAQEGNNLFVLLRSQVPLKKASYPQCTLVVRQLPRQWCQAAGEGLLRQALAAAGLPAVEEATVLCDRKGWCRGTGFVTFVDEGVVETLLKGEDVQDVQWGSLRLKLGRYTAPVA